jgi:hypothetical protein
MKFQLIINKELTADNEEQDNTCDNIGERLVKTEYHRNLSSTCIKEYK